MTRRATRVPFLVGLVLILAACGGSGGTSPAASDAGGGGTTATTAPNATEAPAAGATEDTSSGSGGGGGAAGDFGGKVCDLVTLDEMNAVTAIAATKQDEQPFAQGSGFCTYTSADAALVAATSLVGGATTDSTVLFSSYKADPSAESVPVTGAEAIWFGNNFVAMVHKNGYLGSVQVAAAAGGDAKTASVALLQAMADRMP